MFSDRLRSLLRRREHGKSPACRRQRQLRLETLESRQLLTLLGFVPDYPRIQFNQTGQIHYNAVTHTFDLSATPLTFQPNVSTAPIPITSGANNLQIHILVDNAGNLASSSLADFSLSGSIDVNGDTIPDYTGVLLSGRALQFGYRDVGTTDSYDFRFLPTGGSLLPLYAGQDIGVVTASEHSSFAGAFTANFDGGAKGTVGPLAPLHNVIVVAPDKSPATPQVVQVIDQNTGRVLTHFTPYDSTAQGGIRLASGDLNNDGFDEIVTAPGRSTAPEIRVYSQSGTLLMRFMAYPPTRMDGVQVAVADVDGDGLPDIITVPSQGPAEVKVFRNLGSVGGVPQFDPLHPYRDFLAFPASYVGGAVIAAADMGSTSLSGIFSNVLDHKAEIIIGSGPNMKPTVEVFDVSRMTGLTPTTVKTPTRTFSPFATSTTAQLGGVSLAVGRFNADLVPDILVGAGANGQSLVDVWAWNTSNATLTDLSANGRGFAAFTGASSTAPVHVAALDINGDGICDAILATQGPGDYANQLRVFKVTSTSPLTVSTPTTVPGTFLGPFNVTPIGAVSPSAYMSQVSASLVTAVPQATSSPAMQVNAKAVDQLLASVARRI